MIASLLCALVLLAAPASASEPTVTRTVTTEVLPNGTVVTTTTTITEYIEAYDDYDGASARLVDLPTPQLDQGVASYGPFKVLDGKRAAIDGITDSRSPAAFRRMLAANPGIEVLEFHDCPGTYDDLANLQLARMIRAKGLATHVPNGGSVRSGAVELFLGGKDRRIDDGAEFAVHAWEDEYGKQANDFALSHRENAKYLNFYRDMGMTEKEALAFYAMTNSVRHEDALWLDAADMRGWLDMPAPSPVRPLDIRKAEAENEAPQLAYLDLGASLN